MQMIYETFELDVPANSELIMDAITAREGAIPSLASVGRSLESNTDFLMYVNDSMVVDIPYNFDMGFGSFLPFYYDLKLNDVVRVGFRNRSGSLLTLKSTIQYYYPKP